MLLEETQKMTDEYYTDILNSCGGRLSIRDAKILYDTALGIDAQTILEIGSMDGCSSMVLGEVCKVTDGHLYCLEPNPKTRWKANMERLGLSDYATTIMKASPWVDPMDIGPVATSVARSELTGSLWTPPIDYLLIDGDHRTAWTITDYRFWEPYVRQGGVIAFHDWTGAKGVAAWVQRGVGIILEDDADGLEEIARDESSNRGIIVFKKTVDFSLSRRWKNW